LPLASGRFWPAPKAKEARLTVILRRANVSRIGGERDESDYDVFDGERCVGRIFLDANHTSQDCARISAAAFDS
jgi:hypothetical protein